MIETEKKNIYIYMLWCVSNFYLTSLNIHFERRRKL